MLVAQVAAASFMRRNSGDKKQGGAKSISSKRGSGAKVIGVEDATTTPQAAAYDAEATAQAADPAQPNADWRRRCETMITDRDHVAGAAAAVVDAADVARRCQSVNAHGDQVVDAADIAHAEFGAGAQIKMAEIKDGKSMKILTSAAGGEAKARRFSGLRRLSGKFNVRKRRGSTGGKMQLAQPDSPGAQSAGNGKPPVPTRRASAPAVPLSESKSRELTLGSRYSESSPSTQTAPRDIFSTAARWVETSGQINSGDSARTTRPPIRAEDIEAACNAANSAIQLDQRFVSPGSVRRRAGDLTPTASSPTGLHRLLTQRQPPPVPLKPADLESRLEQPDLVEASSEPSSVSTAAPKAACKLVRPPPPSAVSMPELDFDDFADFASQRFASDSGPNNGGSAASSAAHVDSSASIPTAKVAPGVVFSAATAQYILFDHIFSFSLSKKIADVGTFLLTKYFSNFQI